jgi:iron complex transport system substrate-binding protein
MPKGAEHMPRIVSLLASATEMIAELGCLDQMVGRSHECDFPPEVQRLPLVSNVEIDVERSSAQIDAQIKERAHARDNLQGDAMRALSIYRINAPLLQQLRPDIIFTQTQCAVCAVSEHDVSEALRQVTGLQPKIVSLAPYRLSDVWEDMLRVGNALGLQKQAEARIDAYQQRLHNLSEFTGKLAEKAGRPRVAVLEWLDPLMAAGNWVPELIEYAAGEAIFGRAGEHSPWLTWEELQSADPDVVLLSPCGYTLERTMKDVVQLRQRAEWSTLRATREGRVYAIDGNYYLNRSGPRLVESAELIGRALWAEHLSIEVDARGWTHIEK